MLGLISLGPQGDMEAQERRAELVPATTGEVLGAMAAATWAESPLNRRARTIERGYTETTPGDFTPLSRQQATDESAAFMPSLPGQIMAAWRRAFPGEQPLPPSPMVPLATLKEQYEIPGVLSFDKDTPQSVAQSLYDYKRDQMAQQDAIGRADNMLTSGLAARFATSMVVSLADPINLAAMFVPGLNEAAVARMAGVGAGAGALARAGVRAGAGATQGAAGMIALEPLNYLLMKQDHDDWTATGALANVLFGTIAGAGLHSGMGALAERSRGLPDWAPARAVSEQMQNASPEVQQAVARNAVAAQAEGRPVDAAALLDMAEGLEATAQLRRLADAQTRYDAEASTAMADVRALREAAGRPNTRAEAAASLGDTAGRLRAEAQGLDADIARVQERIITGAMDEGTSSRLAAIDAEMAGTIPAARRRALGDERQMLMGGRRAGMDQADDLTAGRDAAELRGLREALARTTTSAEKAEKAMALASREADVAAAQRADLSRRADIGERAALSRLAAREALVDANAARAVRQIAGAMDTRLSPQEATELGRAIARGHIGLDDALLAIERWKTDKIDITPTTMRAEPSLADLLATAERDSAAASRAQFDGIAAARRVDPALSEPPAPGRRTDLPPPEPRPPGEPSAVARDIAEIERHTAALDEQIKMLEGEEPLLGERLREFDKATDEETRVDEALYKAAAACLTRIP